MVSPARGPGNRPNRATTARMAALPGFLASEAGALARESAHHGFPNGTGPGVADINGLFSNSSFLRILNLH